MTRCDHCLERGQVYWSSFFEQYLCTECLLDRTDAQEQHPSGRGGVV